MSLKRSVHTLLAMTMVFGILSMPGMGSAAAQSADQDDQLGPDDQLPSFSTAELVAEYSATEEELERWMAEEVAEMLGIASEEASRRLDRQESLAVEVNRLAEFEGDRVAGWGFDQDQPELVGFVWLTGDRPATVEGQALADSVSDLEIRYGATHSFEELEQARDQLLREESLSDAAVDAITYTDINMVANVVEIGVEPGSRALIEADPLMQIEPVAEASLADDGVESDLQPIVATGLMLVAGDGGVPIAIREMPKLELMTAVAGGEALDNRSDQNFKVDCTTGFSARRGSTVGMLTAAHCADVLHFKPKIGAEVRLRTLTGPRVATRRADVQLISVPPRDTPARHIMEATFKCSTDRYCRVQQAVPRANIMRGMVLCQYGAVSGRSCGNVTSTSVRPAGACGQQGCAPVFVGVRGPGLVSCPGDSGGPWFSGRSAYGISTGGAQRIRGGDCDAYNTVLGLFTAIDEAERATGSQVRTWRETTPERQPVVRELIRRVPCDRSNIDTTVINGFEPFERVFYRNVITTGTGDSFPDWTHLYTADQNGRVVSGWGETGSCDRPESRMTEFLYGESTGRRAKWTLWFNRTGRSDRRGGNGEETKRQTDHAAPWVLAESDSDLLAE